MTDKMRERVREFASETVKHFFVIGDGADKLAPWIEGQIITFLDSLEREQGTASETQRLSYQLENDRTKVAEGVTAVINAIKSRDWLTEGRGSYEWDDDKWHTEFAAAAQEILAAIEPLRKIAADWTGCPKNPQEIAAARLEPASEARIRLEATLEAREKAFDWFGDHAPQHCVTRDKELCGWCRGTVEIEAELAQLATTEREGEI